MTTDNMIAQHTPGPLKAETFAASTGHGTEYGVTFYDSDLPKGEAIEMAGQEHVHDDEACCECGADHCCCNCPVFAPDDEVTLTLAQTYTEVPDGVHGAQHTPGPWTVECIDDNDSLAGWAYLIREVEAEYGAANASEDDSLMDAANAHNAANARLIAAAPDLLAALIRARECIEDAVGESDGWPIFDEIDAAIAKARGQ